MITNSSSENIYLTKPYNIVKDIIALKVYKRTNSNNIPNSLMNWVYPVHRKTTINKIQWKI